MHLSYAVHGFLSTAAAHRPKFFDHPLMSLRGAKRRGNRDPVAGFASPTRLPRCARNDIADNRNTLAHRPRPCDCWFGGGSPPLSLRGAQRRGNPGARMVNYMHRNCHAPLAMTALSTPCPPWFRIIKTLCAGAGRLSGQTYPPPPRTSRLGLVISSGLSNSSSCASVRVVSSRATSRMV